MHKRLFVATALAGVVGLAAVVTADNTTSAEAKPAQKEVAAPKKETAAPTSQPASGLKIIEVGTGSPAAKDGDIVLVYYTGKLADGKVFDSTDNHGGKPFQFTLGQGRVIKGWDQGIVGMQIGDKRQLVIPPDLAYGASGSPPTIPANATLTFDVELCGLVRVKKE
jgi:FKBP-type peptidyl-prolyl cis-trans isomerase